GGTKITVTSSSVAAIPSATDQNTGTSAPSMSTAVPALRVFTPPTTLVPASSIRRLLFVPTEPVIPWTSTLLSLVKKIAMSSPLLLRRGQLRGLRDGAVHGLHLAHRRVRPLGEDRAAQLGVVAVQAHHQRLGHVVAAALQQLQGLHDAVGHRVAGGDAAEDVDEHRLDRRVAQDDLQAVGHHLGRGAAADVEEVGG